MLGKLLELNSFQLAMILPCFNQSYQWGTNYLSLRPKPDFFNLQLKLWLPNFIAEKWSCRHVWAFWHFLDSISFFGVSTLNINSNNRPCSIFWLPTSSLSSNTRVIKDSSFMVCWLMSCYSFFHFLFFLFF